MRKKSPRSEWFPDSDECSAETLPGDDVRELSSVADAVPTEEASRRLKVAIGEQLSAIVAEVFCTGAFYTF